MTPTKASYLNLRTAHDRKLKLRLAADQRDGVHRTLLSIEGRRGQRYRINGRECLSFCTNDYLGFASQLCQAPRTLNGSGGSRLVSGNSSEHHRAEQAFACLVDTEDAVLFPSGFQLNVGALPALIDADDHVHSDALNHASLIDGIRLTSATRHILPHLTSPTFITTAPHKNDLQPHDWWVTESVFSMDGDGPTLHAMDQHLARGGALYLDDSHSIGLHNGGTGRSSNLKRPPTALVCPLGKAFGSAGAFIAGSALMCEWIRGHARSFVFTTGVSPSFVHQVRTAIERITSPDAERRRTKLWANIAHLHQELKTAPAPEPPSPIFPIHVGHNTTALAISTELLKRGWHVRAIRPPTVPHGSARLRLCLSADHEMDEISEFVTDLKQIFDASTLPPPGTLRHETAP